MLLVYRQNLSLFYILFEENLPHITPKMVQKQYSKYPPVRSSHLAVTSSLRSQMMLL